MSAEASTPKKNSDKAKHNVSERKKHMSLLPAARHIARLARNLKLPTLVVVGSTLTGAFGYLLEHGKSFYELELSAARAKQDLTNIRVEYLEKEVTSLRDSNKKELDRKDKEMAAQLKQAQDKYEQQLSNFKSETQSRLDAQQIENERTINQKENEINKLTREVSSQKDQIAISEARLKTAEDRVKAAEDRVKIAEDRVKNVMAQARNAYALAEFNFARTGNVDAFRPVYDVVNSPSNQMRNVDNELHFIAQIGKYDGPHSWSDNESLMRPHAIFNLEGDWLTITPYVSTDLYQTVASNLHGREYSIWMTGVGYKRDERGLTPSTGIQAQITAAIPSASSYCLEPFNGLQTRFGPPWTAAAADLEMSGFLSTPSGVGQRLPGR